MTKIATAKQELTPSATFKHEFVDRFNDFILEVNVLATGGASFQNTARDDMVVQGMALSVATIDGVVSILSAINIIKASLAAAVTIPLSMIGILGSFAYNQFKDKKRQREYSRAEKQLDREELKHEIVSLADSLEYLYRDALTLCSKEDAKKFANSCYMAIRLELMKNDKFDFAEVFSLSSLQAVMQRRKLKLPCERAHRAMVANGFVAGWASQRTCSTQPVSDDNQNCEATKSQFTSFQKLSI